MKEFVKHLGSKDRGQGQPRSTAYSLTCRATNCGARLELELTAPYILAVEYDVIAALVDLASKMGWVDCYCSNSRCHRPQGT